MCFDRYTRCASDPVDPHRLDNVLEELSAEIFETNLDLVRDVVVNRAGDQDAARLGHRLQAGSDVDAIAIEIAALDHHISQVDADAQHDPAIFWLIAIGGGHGLLQIDGELHGINGAAELDEPPVTHDLEDAALVAGNQGLQHFLASRLERRQRAGLVPLREPAVADHVGGQNSGEAAPGAIFGHAVWLPS